MILLVGAALWFVVDVMSRPGSGGLSAWRGPAPRPAYTFVDDAVAEMRVGGARQSRPRPTASTAKVITALAVLERKPLALGEDGADADHDRGADADLYRDYADRGGSAVAVGRTALSECEMLVGMLLPSANNLADTLAVWGFRIARRIPDGGNALVRSVGMTSTTVGTDASGFSSSTTSTVQDLTLLRGGGRAKSGDRRDRRARPRDAVGVGVVFNTNSLLGRPGVWGLKTGTTDEAGGGFLFAARVGAAGRLVVGAVQGEGRSAHDARHPGVPPCSTRSRRTPHHRADRTLRGDVAPNLSVRASPGRCRRRPANRESTVRE